MDKEALRLIFASIESGNCLPLLGAGASSSFTTQDGVEHPGLPLSSQLAKELAAECNYVNGTTTDLAKIAEYYLYFHSGDRSILEKSLQKRLQVKCEPRPIHNVLSQIENINIVLTSNFDTLFERAVQERGRPLVLNVYDPTNSRTGHFDGEIHFRHSEIIVHKMHGSIDQPRTMVVTESDYIRYLTFLQDQDRGMPEYFRKFMIPIHHLLFLGYSLEDWNFRVIWEGVLANSNRLSPMVSYAIMKNPTEQQKAFWRTRNIVIIDADLAEFAKELAIHFGLDLPQLGIKKKS